jgi:hypothetical protein
VCTTLTSLLCETCVYIVRPAGSWAHRVLCTMLARLGVGVASCKKGPRCLFVRLRVEVCSLACGQLRGTAAGVWGRARSRVATCKVAVFSWCPSFLQRQHQDSYTSCHREDMLNVVNILTCLGGGCAAILLGNSYQTTRAPRIIANTLRLPAFFRSCH